MASSPDNAEAGRHCQTIGRSASKAGRCTKGTSSITPLKSKTTIARGAVWTLAVVLASSDPAGLAAYEEVVNDPASPSYQQYLTADEWTARFGPSPC